MNNGKLHDTRGFKSTIPVSKTLCPVVDFFTATKTYEETLLKQYGLKWNHNESYNIILKNNVVQASSQISTEDFIDPFKRLMVLIHTVKIIEKKTLQLG